MQLENELLRAYVTCKSKKQTIGWIQDIKDPPKSSYFSCSFQEKPRMCVWFSVHILV